jgi:ElaB/YqjD/DUF883 family membrane-anchored ribosome-binding protein
MLTDQKQEIAMTHDKADDAASASATDLAQLREDISQLKDTLAELVRGEAGQARAAIRNAAKDAKSQVSNAASNAQDSAFAVAADFERSIEKNPLTAVLIATGIGLALGVLSRSR